MPAGSAAAPLFILVSLISTGDALADSIFLANGTRYEDITVDRASWDRVTFKRAGVPQSVPGYTVVRLDRISSSLGQIEALLESGSYEEAEKQVKRSRLAGLRPWEKAKLGYLEGRLYFLWSSQDPSKRDRAIKAYTAYIKANQASKDFYLPHATHELGLVLLDAGQPKRAAAEFKKLSSFGGKRGIWGYRAEIGEARALMTGKNARQNIVRVRQLLSGVRRDTRAPASVKQEASVLLAASYLVSEEPDRAIAEITREFLKKGSDVDYNQNYARACIVMGDAYRLKGGRENLQRAEIWYLKTTGLFGRYPTEYRAAAERLVDVYKALKNAKRAREWEARLQARS